MASNRTIRPCKLKQTLFAASLFAASCLQACGTDNAAQLSSPVTNPSNVNNGEVVPRAQKNELFPQQALEGTWSRPCNPSERPIDEKLSFKDGRFTQEFTSYKNECQDKAERYAISGTFTLGNAALDLKELTFEKGNFALKPATITGVRKIDFVIEEWTFDLNAPIENQDRLDLAGLINECPFVGIEKEATSFRIKRNGCQLSRLKSQLFDIISLRNGDLRLGFYINDLNSFDPEGRTTQELRSNVISNLPLNREK